MPSHPDSSSEGVWPVARNPVRFDSIGRVCWVRLLPSYHEVAVPPESLALIAGFTWRHFGTLLCIDGTDEARLAGAVIPDTAPPRAYPDQAYAVACIEVPVVSEGADGCWSAVPDAPRVVCLLPMEELLDAAQQGVLDLAQIRRLAQRDVLRGGMALCRVRDAADITPAAEEFPTQPPWRPSVE